ncbi:N-acetyl-gamma-glutamyl-phosphate reductase [Litoribacter populi]|uniref:N-acetyl-gamma-glutamyl-phosphate reductase n=1 Tax=Litoribacter populi TaxID=2598460 RepID=UPI00117C7091|nr:N-acetyl-gamma-glutamyl-phosphate reductase [Litoribacter populi]
MDKIKVGVIGGAGYTGGELIRLLVFHPQIELVSIHSNSQKGKKIYEVHQDLIGDSDLVFTDEVNKNVDAVFLALPHGEAKGFLEKNEFLPSTVIIDLSTDFRDESENFVYGMPEINKSRIINAKKIANPGCFATGIQLALAPAIAHRIIEGPIHINGVTGSTGAGKKLSETTHFSERNQNVSVYKLFDHQHLKEIKKTFHELDMKFKNNLFFVPYRGNFSRGIWITAYGTLDRSIEEVKEKYQAFYADEPFTHVSDNEIMLKQAVNTNKCLISLQEKEGQLVIYAAIDNLLKGAAGQAVQNMNLAFGLDEKTGLNLKSIAF